MRRYATSARHSLTGGLATVLALGVFGLLDLPARAREAKCPYCRLDVVPDTTEQDNRAVLTEEAKRTEYRCVYCAIARAKTDFKGDLAILAPSEIKGKPVLITRKDGKWTAAPANPVFVAVKVNHRQCQSGYRAFTNQAAFDAHVRKNPGLLRDARPLTLTEMVEISK